MQCLEPLTTSIEVLELREVDRDWMGDLLGYFAIGHHDPIAFAQSVNTQYDPDLPAEAPLVRQAFWMEYPLEIDSDCYCFRACKADVEGSFAVTYIKR